MKSLTFKGEYFYALEYLERNKYCNWHLGSVNSYKEPGISDYVFIAVTDNKHAERFMDYCEHAAGICLKSKKARRCKRLPFTGEQIKVLWVNFISQEIKER